MLTNGSSNHYTHSIIVIDRPSSYIKCKLSLLTNQKTIIAFLFEYPKRFPRWCFSTTVQRFEWSIFLLCVIVVSKDSISWISSVILNVQVWKNISFVKECFNIKLANMALWKQQLAANPLRDTFPVPSWQLFSGYLDWSIKDTTFLPSFCNFSGQTVK